MKNDNGFFLMVEAGHIDKAHHSTKANKAMSETVALDLAVEETLAMLGDRLNETLVIVTSDHSHTMAMSGYPTRGKDIRGRFKGRFDGAFLDVRFYVRQTV
jgi:alkaline phosphatase